MSLALQKLIFENIQSRRDLLHYVSICEKKYLVQVFRNHSFELVEHTLDLYLDYAGIGVSFSYSGYDDSLSFLELNPNADSLLIWIDTTRYTSQNIQEFLTERIKQLRLQYEKPILIVPFGKNILLEVTGVSVFNLDEIESELGNQFRDERAREITGTSLSSKAMLAISRKLGLNYLPALLCPALKAIIVDLDNTLYQGILGEDGIEKIILTDAHKRLQEELKKLGEKGFFLCIASKNDQQDVEQMFQQREDFPLKKEDFSKICASWVSKAEMIKDIAKFLNINPDSMLFLDDNIGELIAVQASIPEIKEIHANENADITRRILEEYPGLLKLNYTEEDKKRKNDIQANIERQELRHILSQEDYIRSLKIHLTFYIDNIQQIVRMSELSNKTNQFIFNYKRYTQQEIEKCIKSDEYVVVAVSLTDRLSDSGMIAICVGKNVDDYVEVEECLISCRALGRGVDDIIVMGAISKICQKFQKSKVKVLFQKGARNTPAEAFVTQYLSSFLQYPKKFFYQIPNGLFEIESIE